MTEESNIVDFKREYLSFKDSDLAGTGDFKELITEQAKRSKLSGKLPDRDLINSMFDIAIVLKELGAVEEAQKWKARYIFELATGSSVDGWQTQELNTQRIHRSGDVTSQPAQVVEQYQQQQR